MTKSLTSGLTRKDIRRHDRVSLPGLIHISWEDALGVSKQTQVKCLDISKEGLRVEIPEPIRVGARVSLRADWINLHGSGTVKHLARRGNKYILGVNLSQALRDQALASMDVLNSLKPLSAI